MGSVKKVEKSQGPLESPGFTKNKFMDYKFSRNLIASCTVVNVKVD